MNLYVLMREKKRENENEKERERESQKRKYSPQLKERTL